MMPTEIEILKSNPFFQDLSSNDLEILSSIIHRVKVHEGETLTQSGMTAAVLYININGSILVSYENDRAVWVHKAGELVGVSVGVIPSVYKGTAVALTDGELLSVSGNDLLDLLQGNNLLGEKVIQKINAVSVERSIVMNGE